jgi:integrase
MATFRKVKTKRGEVWQARWRERGRGRAKNFASKRAAQAYANRMEELIERRGVGDAERLTTAAYLDRFVAEIEVSDEYSPATVTSYRKMTTVAARVFGATPLSRLSTAVIEDGYTALLTGEKPLTRATVRFVHRILVLALNRAVRRELIAVNPAINAAPPGSRKSDKGRKVRVFSPEEVTALLAAAERDDQPDTLAIVLLLLVAGLRRAELLGIRVDDVDLDNGLLHVRGTVIEVNGRPVVRDRGKSAAAQRTLALPPTVVSLLRGQRVRAQEAMLGAGQRSPGYLFPGPAGQPMPPPWLTRRLKRLMHAAGISGRAPCHAWRHTSGTLTFDAFRNSKLVQARLGHSRIATTMQIYVHSLEEREREAAAHFERLLTKNKS